MSNMNEPCRIQMSHMCCSVLQCVAVCCSALQCVAVCCGVLHTPQRLQCLIPNQQRVCCSVLRCVAVRGVCCSCVAHTSATSIPSSESTTSVLQRVAMCCSAWCLLQLCCTHLSDLNTKFRINLLIKPLHLKIEQKQPLQWHTYRTSHGKHMNALPHTYE